MCGIAGYVGDFLPGLAERMNAAQAHRGPDGRGVFEDPAAEVALAHLRLAILDLSPSAAQPMTSPCGRFTLVYNGEVYNFRELRAALEPHVGRFDSTGDTEVLLLGLAHFGPDFLRRVNGMFAFALWDAQERELLLARDPVGIKPLYYAEPAPGALLFASEIKALCAHPGLDREPDFVVLRQHLAFCHATGDATALRGVRRLPPGSVLRWRARDRSYRIDRYWSPAFSKGTDLTFDRAAGLLGAAVREATVRQLVADVPVGALFSGGLDSSLIVQAAGQGGLPLRCFLTSYPTAANRLDGHVEDRDYAVRYAAQSGIDIDEIVLKPDLASLWPRLIYHLDEPIADPAAIACYLISERARKSGTPVLLSGQGADELFGGYPRYAAMQAGRLLDRLPGFLRRSLPAAARRLLPGSRPGPVGVRLRRLRRLLTALDRSPSQRFLAYCASCPEDDVESVFAPEVRSSLNGTSCFDEAQYRLPLDGANDLDRCLGRDLSVYLPNHNLLYTDKMGMAVGVETRVPLLDQELVDLVTPWPAAWKVRGAETKAVLRAAARPVLPRWLVNRPKGGFGAPYRTWLRHDLAGVWEDLTSEAAVRRRGWFDLAALRAVRQRSQEGSADLYMLQWAIITVELWARQFVDQNPAGISACVPTEPVVAAG